jgi:ankyrin repeat protein
MGRRFKTNRISCENTPLYYTRNPDVAEFLIEKGADIDARNNLGRTPLFGAIVTEQQDIVKMLINKGVTPLHNNIATRGIRH